MAHLITDSVTQLFTCLNRRIRLSVVDNEPVWLDVLRGWFDEVPFFNASYTTSGDEAARELAGGDIHVCLADLFDVGFVDNDMWHLAANYGKSIPVIYVSAYAGPEESDTARDTHAFGVFAKPFTPNNPRFIAKMKAALIDRIFVRQFDIGEGGQWKKACSLLLECPRNVAHWADMFEKGAGAYKLNRLRPPQCAPTLSMLHKTPGAILRAVEYYLSPREKRETLAQDARFARECRIFKDYYYENSRRRTIIDDFIRLCKPQHANHATPEASARHS
jgi:CheY-like chemotaxis protein